MDFLEAIILGIIQGIAEWLPISSEAMVTLAGRFLFQSDYHEALGNAIWLHSGTMLSALIYFRDDVFEMMRSIPTHDPGLLIFLLIATVSTAFTAVPLLLLAFSIELPEALFTTLIGLFLVLIAFLQRRRTASEQEAALEPRKALVAGLVQGFAVLPGLSRSGLTVAALLSQRYSLKESLRLSFLMSIPVTAGIQVFLPVVQDGFMISMEMLVGSLAAAAVGLLTIRSLMAFAERFSFFRATLGLGLLVIALGLLLF